MAFRVPKRSGLLQTHALQAIWDEQSALQKAVQQLCGAVTAGDAAAVAAAADAQPRLLKEGVFDVQTGAWEDAVLLLLHRCSAAKKALNLFPALPRSLRCQMDASSLMTALARDLCCT